LESIGRTLGSVLDDERGGFISEGEVMKICLISGSYPNTHCGVGDQVSCLAEKLAAEGETVSVITSVKQEITSAHNVTVYPVVPDWSARQLPALVRCLDQIHPHIINLHYPSLGYEKGLAPNLLFAWLAWKRPQWKRVLTVHEYETYTMKGRLRLFPAIRFAHRVVCTNKQDQKLVWQMHAPDTSQVQVIPLGSNVGSAEECSKKEVPQYPLPVQKKEWLLHFGTVMPNKGWETLLPALHRLKKENLDIGLLVAGVLEPERYTFHQYVQRTIEQLDLQQEIHFTGYLSIEQIPAVFALCTIAVQPYTDGVRLNRSSLIALLAFGKAVISSDAIMEIEQLIHGKHFWAVLPNDDKDLAEGIKKVMSDPDLLQRLQKGALQTAKYFSWKRIVSLYRGMYKQLS
jgi:glycosyltransferase involved in cell wall biosynthesis